MKHTKNNFFHFSVIKKLTLKSISREKMTLKRFKLLLHSRLGLVCTANIVAGFLVLLKQTGVCGLQGHELHNGKKP